MYFALYFGSHYSTVFSVQKGFWTPCSVVIGLLRNIQKFTIKIGFGSEIFQKSNL